MTYCKHCRMLSYYKHGEYMEPPCSVHPIAEWCIFGIEVYSGTGQLSFLSPRGGNRNTPWCPLSPRGIVVWKHLHGSQLRCRCGDGARHPRRSRAQSYRAPDAVPRRVAGRSFQYMRSRLRACVARVPLEDVPLHEPPSGDATEALRELREGGLIAEREYGGLDPDYRNWYTLTETGNAVA